MAKQSHTKDLWLMKVRCSYPHLWKKQAIDDTAEPKFSCTFLMEKGGKAHLELTAAIKALCVAHWGAVPPGLRHCLRDGAERADKPGFGPQIVFVQGNSKDRVTVVSRERVPVVEGDKNGPYGGCYVNASVQLWTQEHSKYGKRVNCQLQGVQFVADGESFGGGGRTVRPEEFPDISGDVPPVDDDPLLG